MANASAPDYSGQLRQLMTQANIPSFRALGQKAGVSEWAIKQLRAGRANTLRLATLLQLSQALNLPVAALISQFVPGQPVASEVLPGEADAVATLRQEYGRLQAQLADQRQQLQGEFEAAVLSALESWLVYWPTAAHAAQQGELPANRLLPLVKPLEQLLAQWGVVAIAAVGAEVPYDPTLHQLIEGMAQPGDPVCIRHTGYWHGDKLLYRAKVRLPADPPG